MTRRRAAILVGVALLALSGCVIVNILGPDAEQDGTGPRIDAGEPDVQFPGAARGTVEAGPNR